MATTADHIAARRDADLTARLVAAAEQAGVPSAQHWVEANLGLLLAVDIGDTTIADVHAFAVGQYQPTPRPGEDPARITDTHLAAAVDALTPAEEPAE